MSASSVASSLLDDDLPPAFDEPSGLHPRDRMYTPSPTHFSTKQQSVIFRNASTEYLLANSAGFHRLQNSCGPTLTYEPPLHSRCDPIS